MMSVKDVIIVIPSRQFTRNYNTWG